MKFTILLIFSVLLIGLLMVGCSSENLSDNPISSPNHLAAEEYNNNSVLHKKAELNNQLARVRSATAKYHNIAKALDDEYVDINLPVPNMGEHYLKASLLDATFDLEKPELLVYAKKPNGKLKLVAVEYAVPVALSPNPPEGFIGDEDHWHIFEGGPGPEDDLWTLHAWVWQHNPDGMFNPTNPTVD